MQQLEDPVADRAADEAGRQGRVALLLCLRYFRAQTTAAKIRVLGQAVVARRHAGEDPASAAGGPGSAGGRNTWRRSCLAMLPIAPSGPSTAPENSEASEVATVAGRSFHLRCMTSPVRLSSIEPSRLLGAWRVLDEQADEQREGQADDREHPGPARRRSCCPRSACSATRRRRTRESTPKPPIRDTTMTWT